MSSFLSFYDIIIYIVAPLFVSWLTWVMKGTAERLRQIEVEMQNKTSEAQVRQIVSDKYDPLSQDIREIKETQTKMFDLYLELVKNKPDARI